MYQLFLRLHCVYICVPIQDSVHITVCIYYIHFMCSSITVCNIYAFSIVEMIMYVSSQIYKNLHSSKEIAQDR